MNATEKMMWRSECRPGETGRDAAVRFVADVRGYPDGQFTTHWPKDAGVGVFTFPDAAWMYRIVGPVAGHWEVWRTGEPSKAGKAYQKARRLHRPREAT